VVVAAALLATVPYMMGERGIHYAYTACVLLVVACPCALVLSTPVVGRCRLTVSKPVLKAPMVSALETINW